jgi:hypothetical protein
MARDQVLMFVTLGSYAIDTPVLAVGMLCAGGLLWLGRASSAFAAATGRIMSI